MELSLSPISSGTPISSFLSPRSPRLRLLRREFLGCGHNLRPPGLGYQRQCTKPGFQFGFYSSKRIVLRASLVSQSTVVLTVVVVSALTVVYLSYSNRRGNTERKEMTGQLTHDMLQHIRSMLSWVIEEQFLHPLDFERKMSVDKKKDLMMAMSQTHEGMVAKLPVIESKVAHGKALATNTSQSSNLDIVVSISSDSLIVKEHEEMPLSTSSLTPSDSDASKSTLDGEVCNMSLNGRGPETGDDTTLPVQIVESKSKTASFPVVNTKTGVNELGKSRNKGFKEVEQSSYDLVYQENLREELYTFYEAPVANFNQLGTLSSATSLQDSRRTLRFKSSTLNGGEFIIPEVLHYSEHNDEDRHLAYFRGGSFHGREDMGQRKDFAAKMENRYSDQNIPKSSFSPGNLKRKHIYDRHNPSKLFSAYNKLLRDGRLSDCIEMLEDMKSKGLLDMDKVYHSGFFQACKRQKAVKEAFRFTQLISNPTLSTFNMLMSVCASSQDSDGAFQVLRLLQEAGLKVDCKLYTTLISTCAKSGKVDTMFKVFHEMVNAEVEPNVHTYGALIDGCAKAGQVAKAFGAYGIMRSKNVKPDRVVFNSLITACGESGAVDRAFDVLAEMKAENQPIDPDHVTVGALMKACARSGQVDRAREVYKMIHEYDIKGTPEVYTIAVNSCSQNGDWEFACSVYNDMTRKGVVPDQMFISALMDVAGHARKLDAAFEILQVARAKGIDIGIIAYSSLMGACSNAKDWEKALQLYQDVKEINLKPTVPMMNALITALCDADQVQKARETLFEMKRLGLRPNVITYSILLVASEKMNDLDFGLMLFSEAKKDGVTPNLVMCRCLIGMCLRRYQEACLVGQPVLSVNSDRLHLDSKWTSLALMVYREAIVAGLTPTVEELSQVLGCLKLPRDASLRNRLIENLGVSIDATKGANLCSLVDGFCEYDPRAFSLLEEAASFGIVSAVSLKQSPISVDVRNLQIPMAEVYLLTILKGLKHRLAAGVKLPNLNILLPLEKTQIQTPRGEKTIKLAGRVSQAIAALLRRLGLTYQGNESHGKIRINGGVLKKWFQPKLDSPFSGKPTDLSSSQRRLGKGISYQQRNIRIGNLSLEQ